MTTGNVSELSSTGATLSGSYSGASGTVSETGFYWGTSEGSLSNKLYADSGSGAAGDFSKALTGLKASTTYYYKAYVIEYNESTSSDEYKYSEVKSFTTAESLKPTGWLELPAKTGSEDFCGKFYGSAGTTGANRNYSYNYSYEWYASLWVAYPLSGTHKTGSASTSSWRYNPNISSDKQVNVNNSSYGAMYGDGTYSRGHQCPNASRKSDDTMNLQTYYVTNQTPQRQNKFNASIWSSLETAERNLVSSATDTVYIVTGPVYRKAGGAETITYLTGANGKSANPESLAVPNYYWKAFLKVKWSGTGDDKIVTSASAIGFWFEHKDYETSDSYTNYAVSIDQIETWTGFDLFANLPDSIESAAETNTNWSTFQSF